MYEPFNIITTTVVTAAASAPLVAPGGEYLPPSLAVPALPMNVTNHSGQVGSGPPPSSSAAPPPGAHRRPYPPPGPAEAGPPIASRKGEDTSKQCSSEQRAGLDPVYVRLLYMH